jgi:hypothetical protein
MEFALTSPKWEGEIRLKYHHNGYLEKAKMPEVIDINVAKHMATRFPLHISILAWFKQNTKVKITEIEQPTNFDAFWEAYNKKVGSRINAQLYWDGDKKTLNKRPITEADRQLIMKVVKRYTFRYQGAKKEFQPLATTFLNQRLWECEAENVRENEVDLLKLIEAHANK